MKGKILVLFLATCLLVGCNRLNRLPSSTGQPYEVALVGDTDSVLTRMLLADVEGLPQAEPMCRLIQVRKGHDKGLFSLVRIKVIVDVDRSNKGYDVLERKNVNAEPQMVLWIKARTVDQLRSKLDGRKLRALIDDFELKHLVAVMKQNPKKQKEMKALFGLDMKIPVDMDASKNGKNFRWISNNANTGMQSLLLFKVEGLARLSQKGAEGKESLENAVDSVLRKNMPGETDEMFMQLSSMDYDPAAKIYRGLWEMKGDAMGGPYVMKVEGDIVVMGFVYAPEMKKKILTKQLEAVLTTVKFTPHAADN